MRPAPRLPCLVFKVTCLAIFVECSEKSCQDAWMKNQEVLEGSFSQARTMTLYLFVFRQKKTKRHCPWGRWRGHACRSFGTSLVNERICCVAGSLCFHSTQPDRPRVPVGGNLFWQHKWKGSQEPEAVQLNTAC